MRTEMIRGLPDDHQAERRERISAASFYEVTIEDPEKARALIQAAITDFDTLNLSPLPKFNDTTHPGLLEKITNVIKNTDFSGLQAYLGAAEYPEHQRYQYNFQQQKQLWQQLKFEVELSDRALKIVQLYAIKRLFDFLYDQKPKNYQGYAQLQTLYHQNGVQAYYNALTKNKELYSALSKAFVTKNMENAKLILNMPLPLEQQLELGKLLEKEFSQDTYQIEVELPEEKYFPSSENPSLTFEMYQISTSSVLHNLEEQKNELSPLLANKDESLTINTSMNAKEIRAWLDDVIDKVNLNETVCSALRRMQLFLLDAVTACQKSYQYQKNELTTYHQTIEKLTQDYSTQATAYFKTTLQTDETDAIMASNIGKTPLNSPLLLEKRTNNTLLHIAMRAYKISARRKNDAAQIVAYLIKRGLSVTALNAEQQTPYQFAGVDPSHQWNNLERENLRLIVKTSEQQQALAVLNKKHNELYAGGVAGFLQRGVWFIFLHSSLEQAYRQLEHGVMTLSLAVINNQPLSTEITQMIKNSDAYFWEKPVIPATAKTRLLASEEEKTGQLLTATYGSL